MNGESVSSAWDRQEGGDHYSRFKIQPTKYIADNGLGWYAGNVIKYVTRAPFKGQFVKDLRKAIHYIELWIEDHESAEDIEEINEDDMWKCLYPSNIPGKVWCGATRIGEHTPCPEADTHRVDTAPKCPKKLTPLDPSFPGGRSVCEMTLNSDGKCKRDMNPGQFVRGHVE